MTEYRFDDGVLKHEDFHCSCGRSHVLPIHEIVVRRGAIEDVVPVLRRLDIGMSALMICDQNTFDVAGAEVERRLRDGGFSTRICRFETREWVKPDEYAIGKVMLEIDSSTELLVVVGSGCLTDLTRFVATRTGLPFVSVPTAPSMDGYASSGAPMTQGGYKKTIICRNAHAIIADVDVLGAAPLDMIASGFADTIGKLTSRIDWKLSQIVTGEYYCDFFVDLIQSVVDRCVGDIDALHQRSPGAVAALAEGLVYSGIAMLLIGNSRPASGSEHSLSHYWEMKAAREHRQEYFHGTKVGVAAAVMARFMVRFFDRLRATTEFDLDAIRRAKKSLSETENALHAGLGPVADGIIEEVTRRTYLSWEDQERQIRTIGDKRDEILALASLCPSPENIDSYLERLDAPSLPSRIGVDPDYLRETLLNAKEVRSRYTVLRAAESLGWLEEIAEEVVQEYTGT